MKNTKRQKDKGASKRKRKKRKGCVKQLNLFALRNKNYKLRCKSRLRERKESKSSNKSYWRKRAKSRNRNYRIHKRRKCFTHRKFQRMMEIGNKSKKIKKLLTRKIQSKNIFLKMMRIRMNPQLLLLLRRPLKMTRTTTMMMATKKRKEQSENILKNRRGCKRRRMQGLRPVMLGGKRKRRRSRLRQRKTRTWKTRVGQKERSQRRQRRSKDDMKKRKWMTLPLLEKLNTLKGRLKLKEMSKYTQNSKGTMRKQRFTLLHRRLKPPMRR